MTAVISHKECMWITLPRVVPYALSDNIQMVCGENPRHIALGIFELRAAHQQASASNQLPSAHAKGRWYTYYCIWRLAMQRQELFQLIFSNIHRHPHCNPHNKQKGVPSLHSKWCAPEQHSTITLLLLLGRLHLGLDIVNTAFLAQHRLVLAALLGRLAHGFLYCLLLLLLLLLLLAHNTFTR